MTTTHFVDVHVLTPPEQRAAVSEALRSALSVSIDAEGVVRPVRMSRRPWPVGADLVSLFFVQDGKSSLSPKDLVKAFEEAVTAASPAAVVVSLGFCLDEAQVWCRAPSKEGFRTHVEADPEILEHALEADWNSVVASKGVDDISARMLPLFLESKPLRKALERAGYDAPSPKTIARRMMAAAL